MCKVCINGGAPRLNHDKLQVCKVTEQNLLHIDDNKKRGKLDEDKIVDIKYYSYNNNLAYNLWGNDVTQRIRFATNELDKEVCKHCGCLTHTLINPQRCCALWIMHWNSNSI